MSSLHHWLVALGRGLKRDKHKRRIEEEARRDRLKLEAYREQMRAEALVEVERLGIGRAASRNAPWNLSSPRAAQTAGGSRRKSPPPDSRRAALSPGPAYEL